MLRMGFLWLVFCLQGILFAQQNPAEQFVKNLSERKNSWLIDKNTDSLANLLDKRCLYIHSNGWQQTANEVVADLNSKKLVYKAITISDLQARQFEKMVIVTGKGRFAGTVSEKPFDMVLAFTEVFIKRKDGWKLVSRHSNKIDP